MNFGKFVWGLIVILIGLGFLLVNFKIVDASNFANIWRLWPAILIVIGLAVLANALPRWVAIIVNILLILTILGSFALLVYQPQFFTKNLGISETNGATQNLSVDLKEQTKQAKIIIKNGAVRFNLDSKTSKLLEASVESNVTTASLSESSSPDSQTINLIANSFKTLGFNNRNSWDVHLSDKLPLEIQMETGAITADLDMSNLQVKNLDVKSGASTFDVRFSDKLDVQKATFSLGASTLRLHVPKGSGIKITNDSGLSSNNFEREGLSRSDKTYTSDNYNSASKKIEITLKTGASTLDLDRF